MPLEEAGIAGRDRGIDLDAEIDPVAHQLAIVGGRVHRIAIAGIALVVAAAGAQWLGEALRAVGLLVDVRAFEDAERWKEAADNHESVARDALVMPISSGRPPFSASMLTPNEVCSAEKR